MLRFAMDVETKIQFLCTRNCGKFGDLLESCLNFGVHAVDGVVSPTKCERTEVVSEVKSVREVGDIIESNFAKHKDYSITRACPHVESKKCSGLGLCCITFRNPHEHVVVAWLH